MLCRGATLRLSCGELDREFEKKSKVVKVLKAGSQLSELGNSSAALDDAVKESTAFIAVC